MEGLILAEVCRVSREYRDLYEPCYSCGLPYDEKVNASKEAVKCQDCERMIACSRFECKAVPGHDWKPCVDCITYICIDCVSTCEKECGNTKTYCKNHMWFCDECQQHCCNDCFDDKSVMCNDCAKIYKKKRK